MILFRIVNVNDAQDAKKHVSVIPHKWYGRRLLGRESMKEGLLRRRHRPTT